MKNSKSDIPKQSDEIERPPSTHYENHKKDEKHIENLGIQDNLSEASEDSIDLTLFHQDIIEGMEAYFLKNGDDRKKLDGLKEDAKRKFFEKLETIKNDKLKRGDSSDKLFVSLIAAALVVITLIKGTTPLNNSIYNNREYTVAITESLRTDLKHNISEPVESETEDEEAPLLQNLSSSNIINRFREESLIAVFQKAEALTISKKYINESIKKLVMNSFFSTKKT